jgi:hypothetical protein
VIPSMTRIEATWLEAHAQAATGQRIASNEPAAALHNVATVEGFALESRVDLAEARSRLEHLVNRGFLCIEADGSLRDTDAFIEAASSMEDVLAGADLPSDLVVLWDTWARITNLQRLSKSP